VCSPIKLPLTPTIMPVRGASFGVDWELRPCGFPASTARCISRGDLQRQAGNTQKRSNSGDQKCFLPHGNNPS
jgi:hypothetical protein